MCSEMAASRQSADIAGLNQGPPSQTLSLCSASTRPASAAGHSSESTPRSPLRAAASSNVACMLMPITCPLGSAAVVATPLPRQSAANTRAAALPTRARPIAMIVATMPSMRSALLSLAGFRFPGRSWYRRRWRHPAGQGAGPQPPKVQWRPLRRCNEVRSSRRVAPEACSRPRGRVPAGWPVSNDGEGARISARLGDCCSSPPRVQFPSGRPSYSSICHGLRTVLPRSAADAALSARYRDCCANRILVARFTIAARSRSAILSSMSYR
jgi:hypothetical protein